jgi:hypothetical protein
MQFLGIQMGNDCHSKLGGIHPFESKKIISLLSSKPEDFIFKGEVDE